ncbi:MAG: sulfatase-like hydrolase/transferase [Alphaproteobacteria bacterium]|nr:sulfatase-like hydrolase/transferase [Alphaproteobacteria bacterium]
MTASPPAPDGPSVVLVTLDTTRADHLGAYGGAAATPAFDGLADRGMLFERAYSSAPLTIPSHSTILTGRFPPSHGVRDNGNYVLPDSAVTLAERFGHAGYATAAFTAAFPTSRRWGFAQGFDTFSDALVHDPVLQDWRDARPAGPVVDEAVAWLDDVDGPVFLWVHLFDAHWPYAPPEPFASRYGDRPYDGEIAYADSQLGRLLDAVAAHGPAVVAVTADHGEGLGDGGEATHGFLLHDATIRVPLVLAGPGVPEGVRGDTPVSHVDLAPTLLALAGVDDTDGLQGRSLLDGGTAEVFSEAQTGHLGMGLADLTARTTAQGRYLRGAWAGWYPYDAATGGIGMTPSPGADLAQEEDALAALEQRLGVTAADRVVPAPSDPGAAADATAALEALGYVTGDPDTPAGTLDPRDVIPYIPETWNVRRRLAMGDVAGARAALDTLAVHLPGAAIVEELEIALLGAEGRVDEQAERAWAQATWMDTAEAWRRAGEAALDAGAWEDARAAFEIALGRVPSDARSMVGLVRATLLTDGPDAAQPLVERFLGVFPDLLALQLVAGEADLTALHPGTARSRARAVLVDAPLDPWALSLLARAEWDLGRPDAAIDALDEVRREVPRDLSVRITLATWLLDVGRHAEAVRVLRPAAAELPDAADVHALLARAEAAVASEVRRSRAGAR